MSSSSASTYLQHFQYNGQWKIPQEKKYKKGTLHKISKYKYVKKRQSLFSSLLVPNTPPIDRKDQYHQYCKVMTNTSMSDRFFRNTGALIKGTLRKSHSSGARESLPLHGEIPKELNSLFRGHRVRIKTTLIQVFIKTHNKANTDICNLINGE